MLRRDLGEKPKTPGIEGRGSGMGGVRKSVDGATGAGNGGGEG